MKNLLTLLLLLFSLISFSQTWVNKNSFPDTARYNGIAETINNRVYFGTGRNSISYFKDIWEYNPARDIWTFISRLPDSTGKGAGISFSTDSALYVGLGWDGTSTYKSLYKYSLNTGSWTQMANYPGRGGRNSYSAQIGNKVYVGSGSFSLSGIAYSDFYVYDIALDTWTVLSSTPVSRVGAISFSIDSIMYVGMGHDFSRDYNDLWSYNPTTNTWTQMASCPGTGRLQAVSMVLNQKAIIGGGHRHGSNGRNTNSDYYEYDPITNIWTTMTNTFTDSSRTLSRGFVAGGKAYLYGGSKSFPTALNDIWEFAPLSTSTKEIESNEISKLNIYPNPTSGQFVFEASNYNEGDRIQIFDMKGAILLEQRLTNLREEINLEGWDAGIYFLRFQNQIKKLVISK